MAESLPVVSLVVRVGKVVRVFSDKVVVMLAALCLKSKL